MYELLIPILAFLSVVGLGGAVLLVRAARRQTLHGRLFRQPGDGAASTARPPPLVSTVRQMGELVALSSPTRTDLAQRLSQAGFYDSAAPTIYAGAQFLLVVSALGLVGPLVLGLDLSWLVRACVLLPAVAVAGLLPNLVVFLRSRQRRMEVRNNLPDAIDLLEICVSAGLGLESAWNAVAEEFRGVSPVLADEMALVDLEIHLGGQRGEALRHMAARTGVEDINALCATLVQSERFGTSVSQALRTYTDAMRSERSQRAEEAAEKLAVKLLFPMVVFIFPVLFVVVLGPAAIQIYTVLLRKV